MSFNGSGVFDPPATPQYPAVSGDVIYAAYFNLVMQEIFDGLSNCITKDGQSTLTGDINFSGRKLLNAARIVGGTLTDNGNVLQITGDSTFNGNLTLVGNSRRIQGNFSDANRAFFQTTTTNSSSGVGVIANGTGAGGYFNTYSGSDPANASIGQFFTLVDGVNINSSSSGTGTVQPIKLGINGTTKLTITATEITPSVPINGATFTGTITLPSTVSMGSVSATEISYLDGVTSAIQTQLNAKAPLASPTFTGTPTAPTPADGTNTTQLATTAFVQAAIGILINSAPGALDTLNELATALGNDPNFATTMTNALALKAPLASPALSGTPTAPTAAPGTNTTQLATTAFVAALGALKANLASPTFTGVPAAPTAAGGTNTTQIATTAFVTAGLSSKADSSALSSYAPLASPSLTGTPLAPTAAPGTNTTQIASTAFVTAAVAALAAPYKAYKTTSTSRSSTTTASADPHLLISNPADGVYRLKGFIRWTGNASTANGLKAFLATTGGATIYAVMWTAVTNASTANNAPTANDENVFQKTANATFNTEHLQVEALLTIAGAASIGLSWAQMVSGADATQLLEYSYIELMKLD